MPIIDINYDKCLIGEIEFSNNIIDEGSISGKDFFLSGMNRCEIYVYGNEGNIPHLHIVSKGNRDSCIMLTDNRYFSHGKNTGTLNSIQCKEFNEWMKSKNIKSGFNLTNWESCIFAWNLNSKIILDISSMQVPDYSFIKAYK